MEDGIRFERIYNAEIKNFSCAGLGVDHNAIMAALIMKREGRTNFLPALYSRRLLVLTEIDDDDYFELKDIEFALGGK